MWCQLYFLGSFFLIFLILDDCFGFFDHFSFGALPDTFYVIFHVFGLSKDFYGLVLFFGNKAIIMLARSILKEN